ncbi:MAG: GatB/YqeY domain-containing protein [Crocosphaera sp.]
MSETSKPTTGTLKERISEDIKTAMKARDKVRLETVRSIKKVIIEKETEVRPKGQDQLTPEQELELLAQQAKQRRDSIEQYRQGGRDDLADKEAQELAIIETYLPTQLSFEEIEAIIDKIIASVGASSPKDMGKVMGPAMKELKGKADGKQVQEIVKAKLG